MLAKPPEPSVKGKWADRFIKTGSSYIQSSLAGSVGILERNGIFYPANDQVLKARDGTVSSGNYHSFFRDFLKTGRLQSEPLKKSMSLLYSGEHLFFRLLERPFQDALLRRIDANKIKRFHVLLFIRDPVAHACSEYQQLVKNHGHYGSIEDYFEEYSNMQRANAVLDFLEQRSFCEVTVRNYSALKTLLPPVEAWLSLPDGCLTNPPKKIINRSLTAAELELQRLLNVAVGPSGDLFSKRLCNELPLLTICHYTPPSNDATSAPSAPSALPQHHRRSRQ